MPYPLSPYPPIPYPLLKDVFFFYLYLLCESSRDLYAISDARGAIVFPPPPRALSAGGGFVCFGEG